MTTLSHLLTSLLFIVTLILAVPVSYLLALTTAAWRAAYRRSAGSSDQPPAGRPHHRFLILIPAHNEARLLPTLLANLRELNYPPHLFAVHVVADNCTDETAALARRGGAHVHERIDEERRGKGYALHWLLQRLWAAEEDVAPADRHDAIVILDADSLVSTNFLRVMDAHLARGERVIQAYYTVRAPEQAWSASLRYVALAALHYLRPLGRMELGGSAGLKGNGMTFAADLLRDHPWSASLTEDIEQHMALLLSGERVFFAPDAVVWAEMPHSLQSAHSQNIRWEQGRLEMARRYVPRLLRAAAGSREPRRVFLLLDAVAEHLIPPLSVLVGLSTLSFVATWLWPAAKRLRRGRAARLLALFTILGQLFYILSGLRLARAPRAVYRALFYAPPFVLWKIWLYLQLWFGERQTVWTRTARNRENQDQGAM